jgi:hypothetical protein
VGGERPLAAFETGVFFVRDEWSEVVGGERPLAASLGVFFSIVVERIAVS